MRNDLINCGMHRVKYQASKSNELEYDELFLSITNGGKNGATRIETYEKKLSGS